MGLLLLPDRKHTTTASSKYPNRGWKIERKKNVAEFQTKLTMRNNVLFTSEHLKRPYTEMPFVEVKMSAFFLLSVTQQHDWLHFQMELSSKISDRSENWDFFT